MVVFNHVKHLRFEARPDGPDAAFARRLQDALGGRWGALTVAHQYLMQGWTCRLPGKYRDLLIDLGTEELSHVEMLSTMITRLLQDAPLTAAENDDNPARCADVYSAHLVQAGAGPLLTDSNGVPWSGSYVTASGSLLADFHLNAGAEAQSRLRLARLFHMTADPGVKQLLRYLLARDTMHQNVWLAAIEELRTDGLEHMPVPEAFPDAPPEDAYAHRYLSFSDGADAADGGWARGAAPDGHGELTYEPAPAPEGGPPTLPPADPRLYCSWSREFVVRPAPLFRTFVALVYLFALALHGRWDTRTAVLALAVVAVWAVPVIRDARRSRPGSPVVSAR